MKKPNQSGFTAVEALLIVVLVAILGFTGWYVYKAQNNANKTLDVADKTAASQTQTIKKKSTASTAKQQVTIQDTTYSKLPSDFKTAYVKMVTAEDKSCLDSNGSPISDDGKAYDAPAQYVAGKFVATSFCNASGLFAFSKNQWVFVAKTAYQFKCSDLQKYSIPGGMIGGDTPQCLDANNNTVAYNG